MRFAAILLVVAGCGNAAPPPPPFPSPPTANDADYPAGPYSYSAGYPGHAPDTFPDLLFYGIVVPVGGDAATVPITQMSMDSLRASERYLVLDVGARWCSDCVADEPSMMQLEADYADKGVLGVELLCEGVYGQMATGADVIKWSHDELATGTLLFDYHQLFESNAGIDAFPTYFIIDATTMKIVERTTVTQVVQPLGPTLDALLAGS